MDKNKPLTLWDYINVNIRELVHHPNFSQHALRVATALTRISTAELESIDLSQFPTIATKERPNVQP